MVSEVHTDGWEGMEEGERTFEDDEDAVSSVIEHVPSISLERRRHLHRAIDFRLAAFGLRTKEFSEVLVAAWREVEGCGTRQASAPVHDRRHLQRGFRAIEEGVVDLAVQVVGSQLLLRETLTHAAGQAQQCTVRQ